MKKNLQFYCRRNLKSERFISMDKPLLFGFKTVKHWKSLFNKTNISNVWNSYIIFYDLFISIYIY